MEKKLPLEGLFLQSVVDFGSDYDVEFGRFTTENVDEAKVIISLCRGNDGWPTGMSKVVLDIDLPAQLVPSSTPGHFHLYIDKEVPTDKYMRLLEVLAEVGIIEEGYKEASIARGFTAVRLPWIKKENNNDSA